MPNLPAAQHPARTLGLVLLLGAAGLGFACQTSPTVATAVPGPGASAMPSLVDAGLLSVSAPQNGTVHVSGAPGAVSGGKREVTVAIVHDLLKTYRVPTLLHVGSTYLVAQTKGPVAADGSFADIAVGNAVQIGQSGDKVYVYPKLDDDNPFGPPAIKPIP